MRSTEAEKSGSIGKRNMEKRRPIYVISESGVFSGTLAEFSAALSAGLAYTEVRLSADDARMADIAGAVETEDAAIVVVGLCSEKNIQAYLNRFRELRVPYVFVKEGQKVDFADVAVPVTFLEEEKEKGPFAGAFGRFFGALLHIYKPKDYGSKAERNVNAICGLLDTLHLNYDVREGQKDSMGIEREAVIEAGECGMGMAIVSASREYGLDDIIFGPKERKIIRLAKVPVMLINPRGDLYALCD